jgi:beta-hydroxylase
LILFCDVERPLSNPLARFINRCIGQPFARLAATQNVEGEKIGVLNKVFAHLYRIRLIGKRIKTWDKNAYYTLKWALMVGLLYLMLRA